MNPYLLEELARERERELRSSARRHALLRSHRRRRRPGPALAGMDFVKIENGKILEHPDILPDIPDATANDQDMFSELSNSRGSRT
jgi:hypothetical protein